MPDADTRAKRGWTRQPLFAPSQVLTAEQLNLGAQEQRRRIEKLMRGLHGHGVVFGLAVSRNDGPEPLEVSCGMALDRHGRLLHWPGGTVREADLVAMPQCGGRFTLSIHHACREMPGGGCGPCSDRPQWIDEGVVFSLRKECEPFDRACVRPEEASCIGLDDYICQRNGSREGLLPPAADLAWACSEPGALCQIGCSEVSYDAEAGIPIGCVEIRNLCDDPRCKPQWGFGEIGGACEVRPWVYRTPLLHELIKGCQHDLARVESVRWGETMSSGNGWPDEVEWEEFAQALRQGPEIAFTGPVRTAAVHPGSVFLTKILWEKKADYLLTRRVPAVLEPIEPEEGLASRFRLRVNPGWLHNEIESRSEAKGGGRVELTIRGQMIRDRCGNLLDALPLDYDPSTPPHSRPGGDFVVVMRFGAPPPDAPAKPSESESEPSPPDASY